MVGIARWQFVVLDGFGAMIWAGTWMGLGYIFSDALELVASKVSYLGGYVLVIIGAALAAYIAIKFIRRQLFFLSLRSAHHAR
jgi:membrane protein DedA with SNARE-associated domain